MHFVRFIWFYANEIFGASAPIFKEKSDPLFQKAALNEKANGVCRGSGKNGKSANQNAKTDVACRVAEFEHISEKKNGKRNGNDKSARHNRAN